MEITPKRLEALVALGTMEAENGQEPGSGPSKGDKCFYFFAGKYHQQIDWARREGLVESGHCMFSFTAATLTASGNRMFKPAFCLNDDGLHAVISAKIGEKEAESSRTNNYYRNRYREDIFGKTAETEVAKADASA